MIATSAPLTCLVFDSPYAPGCMFDKVGITLRFIGSCSDEVNRVGGADTLSQSNGKPFKTFGQVSPFANVHLTGCEY